MLPTTPQFLFHSNSNNKISIDNWTYNMPILKNGDLIIHVGATLNFKSADFNPPGFYTGKYQITFIYN